MKRPSLVCQYLENISGNALEKYEAIIQQYTRSRPGIYALYRNKRIYYIGLARNLRGRLRRHLRDRHQGLWNRFSVYLTIGDAHMKELESLLLRIGKPAGNRQSGKFSRAENLRKRLKRDMVNHHRMLLREVFCDDIGDEDAVPAARRHGLAKFLKGEPLKLRGRYKGKFLYARVRSNGLIRFKKVLYKSPSAAGQAAIGGRGAVDGWWFWYFERAPGDWVRLDALRHR